MSDITWQLKQEQRSRSPVKTKSPAPSDKGTDKGGRSIICAHCGRTITTSKAKTAIHQQHEHVCINPHGIVYHIGCFSGAPGCLPQGEISSHFTWFPGYAWQVVLCADCLVHLGWLFRGSGASFFGLILTRLSEQQEDGNY